MVYRLYAFNRRQTISARDVKMKACVIGAGIGGLSTASLLLQNGWEVEIYEKEKIAGGRALSCKLNDYEDLLQRFEMKIIATQPDFQQICDMAKEYKIDLGFHLIGGGKRGACIKLLRQLNIKANFVGSRLGFIGDKIDYPILKAKDKAAMLPRILQLLFTRKSKIEEMKKLSMEEMIRKYGRGKLKLVLELFPRLITTVNDLSKISAGETFFAQRELLGGDPVVYPYGGLGNISKALAAYIKSKGGKIFFGKRIKRIIIEDGIAKGVEIEGELKEYDAIVSTLPVQHLFSIADEKEFPEEWVKYIRGLEGTGSILSYHALKNLDKNLLNKSFVFIERNVDFEGNDVVGMIDFKMNYETGVTPKGKFIVQSYAICTPHEAKNERKAIELAEIIEKNLQKLLPFKKHMEWSIHAAIWHLDGVAKTIDNEKPNVATPVKNLYLAGDSVASKGVGINCAADSARLVMEELF